MKIKFFLFLIAFSNLLFTNITNFLYANRKLSDTLTFDKSDYFIVGLTNLTIKYPESKNLGEIYQRGIIIGSRKNTTNIDELTFGNSLGLTFNLGRELTLGFFTSSYNLAFPDNQIDTIQHYTGLVNLYGLNINSELIIKMPVVDRKIISGVGLSFLNIGGTASYLRGGRYNGKYFGAVEIIPFSVQIYGKISLKNATFGVGTIINSHNFVEYRIGPRDFIGNDFGIKFNNAQFKKISVIFFIYF